jgi:spore cortex formation protein SpoVR/YcgB (stage V sporulation)
MTFTDLQQLQSELSSFSPGSIHERWLREESLRFLSIAGTIKQSFTNPEPAGDERFITHILTRSLIEGFFLILYVFEDSDQSVSRFEEIVSGFKCGYTKMRNEISISLQNSLTAPDPSWSITAKKLDLKSKLAQHSNLHGSKYDFLYFIYRISSFDTHGISLPSIVESAFGQPVNFPVLKPLEIFDLVADYYYCLLSPLVTTSSIE